MAREEAPGPEWLASPTALDVFAARFAACTLAKDEWTHAAHLAMGAWHTTHFGAAQALTLMRTRIRRLNESFGGVNSATSGYHETVTAAYVELLAQFLQACPADVALVERVRRILGGEMAGRDLLHRFYSTDVLRSARARAGWVEPDLAPLQAPVRR